MIIPHLNEQSDMINNIGRHGADDRELKEFIYIGFSEGGWLTGGGGRTDGGGGRRRRRRRTAAGGGRRRRRRVCVRVRVCVCVCTQNEAQGTPNEARGTPKCFP